jgi:putative protein-disulfide isomerase
LWGMADLPILRYFADPMCSWCWGFTNTFAQIRERFDKDFRFALVMGGLRPYTEQTVTDAFREEILHHWQDVHNMTGQDFSFEDAMPEGFIYDTEPPARAVLTTSRIKPGIGFDFFRAVQQAFYLDQIDVTQTDQLAGLVSEFGIELPAFIKLFESREMRAQTQQHFIQTRQFGVRGFPTLLVGSEEHHTLFTSGYRPFKEIEHIIGQWMDTHRE